MAGMSKQEFERSSVVHRAAQHAAQEAKTALAQAAREEKTALKQKLEEIHKEEVAKSPRQVEKRETKKMLEGVEGDIGREVCAKRRPELCPNAVRCVHLLHICASLITVTLLRCRRLRWKCNGIFFKPSIF